MNSIWSTIQHIFGYSRVSTSKQNSKDSVSLTVQNQSIGNFALKHNVKIEKQIEEIGSAYNGKQSKLVSLLNEIPEFSCVLVYSYDRFSRNVKQALEWIDEYQKRNIYIISCNEQLDYRTSSGRFTFSQLITTYE